VAAAHPIPTIAISMGDPLGIGPEVIAKSLDRARAQGTLGGSRPRARVVVWGCAPPLEAAARMARIAPFWTVSAPDTLDEALASGAEIVVVHDAGAEVAIGARKGPPGPCAEAGAASFAWVEACVAMARAGRADAIVTGPISKEAWAMAEHAEFPGHTELLATRFGATKTRMMFVAPELMVMLATTHIPIARVPAALTIERIAETIVLADRACRAMEIEHPRIAVCGLNPHAGEHGLMGEEDESRIRPAIAQARAAGIDATGPFPGDTIFRGAARATYDIVIAMYHDQGLIPVKMLAFERAVNATVGLPVPRTSPDHGTAFDIAGKGVADAGSMVAALDLAIEFAVAARATAGPGS
jgi:4-hydroxythreonine-4-phosphate dehydrogenase